jgi:hypothetical protein
MKQFSATAAETTLLSLFFPPSFVVLSQSALPFLSCRSFCRRPHSFFPLAHSLEGH